MGVHSSTSLRAGYAEVIGDPIAHSRSPLIHKFWLEKLEMEGDYRAVQVREAELSAYLDNRRLDPDWRGCNVSMPHKGSIIRHLDEGEDFKIGAVNCIVPREGRLIGRNTDIAGFEKLKSIDTRYPVCLIGAGGAARAAVSDSGVLAMSQVHIIVRDKAKGQALLAGFGRGGAVFGFHEGDQAMVGCAGVINATPLGMVGFPSMPATVLESLQEVRRPGFAMEMVYDPVRTCFLEQADRAGLETIDGLDMLISQAAEGFPYLYSTAAPREHDAELRDLLTR